MDSQYGIAVTNKFQLFIDEDADPFDILNQQEELKKDTKEKEKGKGKNKQAKSKNVLQSDAKNKPVEQAVQKKEEKPNNQAPPRHDRPPRSARMNREQREPREEGDRRPRRRDENVPPEFREKSDSGPGGFSRPESGRGGGGFMGRGRGRGPRGGRGRGGFGERSGKRDFERHSGSDRTGVKATDKREGSGSRNWGTYKDDLQDEVKETTETETKEWNPSEDAENQDPNQSTESTEAPAPAVDEGPTEMTLDEWKAQQEKKRLKSQFNIRKAGQDDSQWKKGVVYRKKSGMSDEEEESEEEEEEDDEDEDAAKQKNLVNSLKFVFNDSPRRGRGGRRVRGSRGGRGGGRGDRRGGGRDMAPKFDDENDFPSLVKTEA